VVLGVWDSGSYQPLYKRAARAARHFARGEAWKNAAYGVAGKAGCIRGARV